MTLSPTDNRNVVGLAGDAYPSFKVGPVCCAPDCSRFAEHPHHLWRRSQLGGPFDWVKLEDGTILGNKVGLCFECHRRVTDNEVRIIWHVEKFWWCPYGTLLIGDQALTPQPPIHGKPSVTRHSAPDGPASVPTCGECGRALPHKHDGPKEPKRRRKTISITVPDDLDEDGGEVLDVMWEELRKLFGHPEGGNMRYFATVQAFALVLENATSMLADT